MELRRLRYFVTVAEEMHVGRAARRLNMSQPPLSQQLRALQDEIGVELFQRAGRGIELSPAGVAFLGHARRLLAQSAQAVRVAQRIGRGEAGEISVGFVGSLAYTFLPWLLRLFAQRYPDVSCVLHELTIDEQLTALLDGRLQIGLVRPPVQQADLASERVLAEPYVLAVPRGHRLAARRRVAVGALRDEPLITFPRRIGGRYYDHVVGACERAGFSPRVAQEVRQIHAAVGLVSAGLGLAIVPESAQMLGVAGVAFRQIAGMPERADIEIAWRREEASPAVHAFVQLARETLRAGYAGLLAANAAASAPARDGAMSSRRR